MKSEFLIVADRLMEAEGRPMSPRELVDLGFRRHLFSDNVAGKTPHQTMKAKLSVHIRRHGAASPFVRTAPGRFFLRRILDGGRRPFDARPLRPPKSTERVLVYRAQDLDPLTSWQGLHTSWRRVARTIFSRLTPHYIPRFDVEEDNRYVQILTYILVTRGHSLLSYRRGTYNRVDEFLRGAYCVGFGGHVTEADLTLFNADTLGLYDCANRELREELCLPAADRQRLQSHDGLEVVGLINDDSSDVGRRHMAFVMKYEVGNHASWASPQRGEKAITQLRWISARPTTRLSLRSFEYWSQLCLREFAPQLVGAGPTYRLLRRTPLKPPHLLCVIGPVGSGKTLATEVLKDEFGYQEINTGGIVAGLLGLPAVPSTPRAEFQEKAWAFISRPDGPARLARAIKRVADLSSSGRVLVDGVRQLATLDSLRHLALEKRVGVIFVHTPADLAYSFYSNRIIQGATMSDFLQARSAQVEAEVEGLISHADAVLYNWTGRLKYRETICALMRDLRVSPS